MEQRLEKQDKEMTQAAKEITEAVKELKAVVERLAEIQRSGRFPEEEAVRLAREEGVREVRGERESRDHGEEETLGPEPSEATSREQQPRPKVPLLSGGEDPTLAERFAEELHGSPKRAGS